MEPPNLWDIKPKKSIAGSQYYLAVTRSVFMVQNAYISMLAAALPTLHRVNELPAEGEARKRGDRVPS